LERRKFSRARELVVKRDKLSAKRVGEPKVACVVKRQLHSLREDDGVAEIYRHRRDRKRVEQGNGLEQRLSLGESGTNCL
jgi:hypothetical protein